MLLNSDNVKCCRFRLESRPTAACGTASSSKEWVGGRGAALLGLVPLPSMSCVPKSLPAGPILGGGGGEEEAQ